MKSVALGAPHTVTETSAVLFSGSSLKVDRRPGAGGHVDGLHRLDEAVLRQLEDVLADVDPHRPRERRLAHGVVVDGERGVGLVRGDVDRRHELLHDGDRVLQLLLLRRRERRGPLAELLLPGVDGARVVREELLGRRPR